MINMDRPKNNTAKTPRFRFGENLDPQKNPGFEYKINPRAADMVCIIVEDNNKAQERG